MLWLGPERLRPFLCACHLKGLSVAPWYKKQNFCRRHVGWYMLLVKPSNTLKSVVLLNRQYEKRKVIGSILSYTCLIKGYELVRLQYLHAHCTSCRYKRTWWKDFWKLELAWKPCYCMNSFLPQIPFHVMPASAIHIILASHHMEKSD